MPWLEKRSGTFRIVFRFAGERFQRSLDTQDKTLAEGQLARLKENIRLIDLGRIEIPDSVDVATFLLSDGRKFQAGTQEPLRREISLTRLFSLYRDSLPDGALEDTSLSTLRTHEKHLKRILGPRFRADQLHSALGYLRPVDYYRGEPTQQHETRRRKLSQARHRRKQINLGIRQRTLPWEPDEIVSCN